MTKAYLGDWGYTTDEQIDYVVDSINELMQDTPNWTPIVWDGLSPEIQQKLMLRSRRQRHLHGKVPTPRQLRLRRNHPTTLNLT